MKLLQIKENIVTVKENWIKLKESGKKMKDNYPKKIEEIKNELIHFSLQLEVQI